MSYFIDPLGRSQAKQQKKKINSSAGYDLYNIGSYGIGTWSCLCRWTSTIHTSFKALKMTSLKAGWPLLCDSVFRVSIIPEGAGGNSHFRGCWVGTLSQETSGRPGRNSLVKEEAIPEKREGQEWKGLGKQIGDEFLEDPSCAVYEGSQLPHCPLENTQGQDPLWKKFAHHISDAKVKCNFSKKLSEWILSSSGNSHPSVRAALPQWREPLTQCSKISWKRRVGRACTACSKSILPYVVAHTGVGDLWGFGRHQLRKLHKSQRKTIPGAVSAQNDPLGIWWI